MDGTDAAERSVKLTEFSFYGMDIFHHKFDDIHRFIGSSDKEFPGGFDCGSNVDIILVLVAGFSFLFPVLIDSFIGKKNAKVVQNQVCIDFLF